MKILKGKKKGIFSMYFRNIFHFPDFPPNQNKNMNIIIVYFSVANGRSSVIGPLARPT